MRSSTRGALGLLLAGLLVSCSTPQPSAVRATGTPFPSSSAAISTGTTARPAYKSQPQGFSPFALAIDRNGEYAYVGFDLSETVQKVRLSDLTVVAVADLSGYFPIESEAAVLDQNESKLFVYSPTWQKLIVLDTSTMKVIHTISNISIGNGIGNIIQSQYGPELITSDGGLINTETFAVTEVTYPDEFFVRIRESASSPDLWYVVSGTGPGATEVNAGIYNHTTKKWILKASLPSQATAGTVTDLKVLPNEKKAYVAVFDGPDVDGYGSGSVVSVDLANGDIKAIPIDGGALSLETNLDGRWVYVGTMAPTVETDNVLVVDTQLDKVVDHVDLGRTRYGWRHTQINALEVDPANPSVLYGTDSDANSLFKVNVDSLTAVGDLIFNQESLQPHLFVRQPGQATGYVLATHSPSAFVLNLDQATIERTVELPRIRADAGAYDVAFTNSGRLLVAQGETVLEVDPSDMRLLATHPLPPGITGLWSFVLSHDQSSLYAIWPGPASGGWPPDTFLRLNASTLQVEANIKLNGGGFNSRPFELPDGSKLYALGGQQNGAVVVQVIDLTNNTVAKTITFDEPGLQGISVGNDYAYSYDSASHTLFVGATQVVLAIDTDTDAITRVIHLGDVQGAIGLKSEQLVYINAVGMVYSPSEGYLYIAHGDRSFISIYDLKTGTFLPQAIPLKGYFPDDVFANDDCTKIYTLNIRSDSVSVIDVASKRVEKVIDLHAYVP